MSSARAFRGLIVAAALGGALSGAAAGAASPAALDQSREPDRFRLTLKERSSTKGADQQRVNDCKVPLAERGDRHRPAACGPRADSR